MKKIIKKNRNQKNENQIRQIKKSMENKIERKFQCYELFKIKQIVIKKIGTKSERKIN